MNHLQVPLILLAAGESKRMGTPKQLLAYKGTNLIHHAATEVIKSNCEPIIVVLGAKSDRIASEIAHLSVQIVVNTRWQKGIGSSIATGIDALNSTSPNFDAVIVALADRPLITHRAYNLLIERYQQNSVKAVACNYADTFGAPALFDRTLITELSGLDRRGGAKQLLKQYGDRTLDLDLPEAALDIDTPADYQQLLKL